MKNLLKMLMFSLLLLLLGGCLSSEDSVVGVEDPSTGETLYVRVLEYDLASGMGSVEDTATGDVYSGEVIFYDKESITVVEDGDTLSFNIVSGVESADSLATETPPPTVRDTTTDSLDTVKDSTLADTVTLIDTLTTSDPWPYPWEDGQYVYWDSVGPGFHQAFKEAGFDNYVENPYSAFPSYRPLCRPYFYHDIRRYPHAKGNAYVIDDRLMFLIPHRHLALITPQDFTRVPDIDTLIAVRDILRLNKSSYAHTLGVDPSEIDLLTYAYGSSRDPEKVLTTSWGTNKLGTQAPLRNNCGTYEGDTDFDGLSAHVDPGCSIIYPEEPATSLCINRDWFEYLLQTPEATLPILYLLEIFDVDASKDIPLHSINNPFHWAVMYYARMMYYPL